MKEGRFISLRVLINTTVVFIDLLCMYGPKPTILNVLFSEVYKYLRFAIGICIVWAHTTEQKHKKIDQKPFKSEKILSWNVRYLQFLIDF